MDMLSRAIELLKEAKESFWGNYSKEVEWRERVNKFINEYESTNVNQSKKELEHAGNIRELAKAQDHAAII